MKPKMRVTLLNKDLITLEDRLVDQYEELLNGPKAIHLDPYRFEFTITDQQEIDRVISYMQKLRGTLPLDAPKIKNHKTSAVNPYQELYNAVKAKEFVEDIIEYLTEANFRFVGKQALLDMAYVKPKGSIPELDDTYQWMVKVLRYAKEPKNDKFDFTLYFGIKFLGKNKEEKIMVYFNHEKKAVFKRKWQKDNSAINMKKKKTPMSFPEFMTIEERKDWRAARRKVELGRTLGIKEQKFYDRYFTDIKNINDAKGYHCL